MIQTLENTKNGGKLQYYSKWGHINIEMQNKLKGSTVPACILTVNCETV